MDSEQCPIHDCDGLLIELPSINRKLCFGCGTYFEWKLKEGQKSVTIDSVVGGIEGYGTGYIIKEKK